MTASAVGSCPAPTFRVTVRAREALVLAAMTTPHDTLFCDTFADPERAAEFLQAFLPPGTLPGASWQELRLVRKSFVDPELREHHADLVFTVPVRGVTAWIYVLLEHKSNEPRWAAFQIHR